MKTLYFCWVVLIAYTCVDVRGLPVQPRQCIHQYNPGLEVHTMLPSDGDIEEESSTANYQDYLHNENISTNIQTCDGATNFCYSFWKEDINGTVKFLGQGCWESSDNQAGCERESCVADGPPSKALSYAKFCCCSGDLCNANVTFISLPNIETTLLPNATTYFSPGHLLSQTVLYLCIAIILVLALIAWALYACRSPKKETEAQIINATGPGYSCNLYHVDNLKLCAMVGRGRYGTVWKGLINEQPVAVKIFPAQYRGYYINERDLYCLPAMNCPSLLTYYGCDERSTMDGGTELLLVLSLASNGCLQDFLKENTLTFEMYCHMAQSVAKGLAHLHTDIKQGDEEKPCICHRDLNSRNVLVKADLTCCLCDLGFAVKAWGPKYEHKGEQQVTGTRSINEVGTLRYMAPEMLEGAVNLRDCESSLKQIDVYALGLVLWELCTRCSDFYPQGHPVPEYMAPYEKELPHPTFEQMQTLVSRHKARPLFPAGWGSALPTASKLSKDTCEDCWDHDAEARLTALCVGERLQELTQLRAKGHDGGHMVMNSSINTNDLTIHTKTGDETSPIADLPPDMLTVEALINLSPTDGPGKNSNTYSGPPLQAFQGRNPCLERNLMLFENDPFLSAVPLIDRSSKHAITITNDRIAINQNHEESSNELLDGQRNDEYSYRNNTDDFNTNHTSNVGRQAASIPYLQNVMTDSLGNKQTNLLITDVKRSSKVWDGIKNIFDRKRYLKSSSDENEADEKSNLVSKSNYNDVEIMPKISALGTKVNIIDTRKILNGFSTKGEIRTSLINCSDNASTKWDPKIRPTSLPLDCVPGVHDVQKYRQLTGSLQDQDCQLSPAAASYDNYNITDNKITSVMPIETISHKESDISLTDSIPYIRDLHNVSKSCPTSTTKPKNLSLRHNLTRQHSLDMFREVFSSSADLGRLRDPSQRVKTPGDVPPSVRRARGRRGANRLSLYDDRMMVSVGNTL